MGVMPPLRILALCAPLLPVGLACTSDDPLPLPSCPVETQLSEGRCLPTCSTESSCLLTEQCVEGVCQPTSFERPTILAFEAWPLVVDDPGQVQVRYLVQGADKVELLRRSQTEPEQVITTETGAPEAGQETVARIVADTTLLLEAWRDDQYLDTQEITITVRGQTEDLSIDAFYVDRDVVDPEDSVTVTWATSNAEAIKLKKNGETVADDLAAADSFVTSVEEDTEFTLIAKRGEESLDRSVYVRVQSNPGAVVHFADARPPQIQEGDNSVIAWSTEGSDQVIVAVRSNAIFQTMQPEVVQQGRWIVSPPAGRNVYTVRAVGEPPDAKNAVVDVQGLPPPPVLDEVSVDPPLLPPDDEIGEVEVRWSVQPSTAEVQVVFPDATIQNFIGSGRVTAIVDPSVGAGFEVRAINEGGATRRYAWALPVYSEFEPNDLRSVAHEVDNSAVEGVLGRTGVNVDVDWFRFEAFEGATLTAGLREAMCPPGIRIELHEDNATAPIDGAQTTSNGACPRLVVHDLDVGTYLLRLSKPTTQAELSYLLMTHLVPAECGNGVQEGGEQCDDGNQAFGDYCAPDCRIAATHTYRVSQGNDSLSPQPQTAEAAYWTGYTPGVAAQDEGVAVFELPFGFPFYGRTFHGVAAFTNGFLSFLPSGGGSFEPTSFFGLEYPNAIIAPFVANLDASEGQVAAWIDTGPDGNTRRFVIAFENMAFVDSPASKVSGQVHLHEDGRAVIVYPRLGVNADATFYGFIEGPQGVAQGILPGCGDTGCDASRLSGRSLTIQNLAVSPGG